MHRCGTGLYITIFTIFLVALTGCLGKSSPNGSAGGVSSVSLSPEGNVSLDVGATQVFSATGKNATGGTVLSNDIQYIVQSGNPSAPAPISVASNGNGCAGTWDASVAICSPGIPGVALVTAVINGVSSSVTTVYVHQHIDSIQINNATGIAPQYDCFHQGETWAYEGVAYSNNVDISNTVGPMNFSATNPTVATTTATLSGPPGNQVNLLQTTAKTPGITQISANVGGTTSRPLTFTTCLVKAIYLQIGGQNEGGNSITVNNGNSIPVTAIAIDTLYGIAPDDNGPLANPPLTWSTSDPEVAAFSATTNTTGTNSAAARSNLGAAALTASCSPPSCNVGLPGVTPTGAVVPSLPIYASNCNADALSTPCPLRNGTKGYDAISVSVTSTSPVPTYSAWAATSGCQNAQGCTSALFSVTPGTSPIGAILSLPRTPNSLMFNHLASARLYIGSNQGLMYVDVSGNSPTVAPVSSASAACNVTLCGKILTISNDGNLVVVADNVSTPSQVYIYNAGGSGGAPVDIIIPGANAIAAAFSPDQLKLFIVTNTGTMYVYSTVDATGVVPIAASATDVKFSLNGSFAYVSGAPAATSISGFATCDTPTASVLNPVTTTYPTLPPVSNSPPFALYPLPLQQSDSAGNWTEVVLALDPPNIDTFGITHQLAPLQDGQYTCTPPSVTLDASFPKTSVPVLGQNFTPLYAQLVDYGNQFIIVAEKIPAVLVFNVGNKTTTSIPLANGADPLAASASSDGSQVFVAACDQYDHSVNPPSCSVGSIHIVNTGGATAFGQGDFQQVPYVNVNQNNNRNMCNNGGNPAPQCLPDLVAIRPQ